MNPIHGGEQAERIQRLVGMARRAFSYAEDSTIKRRVRMQSGEKFCERERAAGSCQLQNGKACGGAEEMEDKPDPRKQKAMPE